MLSRSLLQAGGLSAVRKKFFSLRPVVAKGFSEVAIKDDNDKPLRDDVKYLGLILGDAIRSENEDVFLSVEKLRKLGREWRANEADNAAFEKIVEEVKSYDANKLIGVSRGFSHFLGLSNAAESIHRIRRLRERLDKSDYALTLKEDSCAGSIRGLMDLRGVSRNAVYSALSTQSVELVLTAHPTEVNRRTMLRKYHRVQEILVERDRPDLLPYERALLEKELNNIVATIWKTDEIRRRKPSPVEEAVTAQNVVENVLWKALPSFIRKLDDVVRKELGKSLPLTAAPIKFASWMGGDRDGNPNVKPETTLEVAMLSRLTAARLLISDLNELKNQLSLSAHFASPELLAYIGDVPQREPYRVVLKQLISRLEDSIVGINQLLTTFGPNTDMDFNASHILKTAEILDPLLLLHRSLTVTGNESVADGQLIDIIRKLSAFGLTLLPLDIRQESTRHTEAMNAITDFLGVGSYASWDEATRREWLQKEIASKRPLLPRHRDINTFGFSPTVVDTLKTFQAAAFLSEGGSLGAYVISQCQQASDVLAVMLLQQDAGVRPLLRIAPLFETLDDLQRSAPTVDALFSMPAYKNNINGHQEIMVGYSDSAKDAGRLAASWAQYNAQEQMVEVGKKHGIDLTFFHGKGGTVGRGGNPAVFQAILSHPPNTINGRFRVTEQGEMITQNLGFEAIAERTFDLFTAGVLSERFEKRPTPKVEWRQAMETLSESSCAVYRQVVREEPSFVPYFRTATPELELSGLNVGSRPAKRNPKGGVESLRAIPWVFAWTQTRLNLPTWLGVGTALGDLLQKNPKVLKEMNAQWPWFHTLMDLLEMILIKSDERVAANYDKQLVQDPAAIALGEKLRAKFRETTKTVLAVTGSPKLQDSNPVLLRSLAVRNPYVDPLNVLQAELLRRLREDEARKTLTDEERQVMQDALLITINGIANGMRNSG